ncbi:ThiJ/PfpI family protein [Talaromyces islandicus]|uniref:D-lactate dehydratase n=1 Tax=Talaromyces islandicus TaxID=28573 RepID=A0A0U1LY42_TALIS|nr:ThiJ/PfpI family protein [Talaromyces islandicus]
MAPKVLVVLTSVDKIPSNDHPTGWFLPEFAHPWQVLHDAGVEMTIASPKGGEAPLDPASIKMFESDELSVNFYKNQQALWKNTVRLAEIVPKAHEYDAIFYVGGHGPMFDLVSDPVSLSLIQTFASAKKPVSAVCHGPVVFVNATTPSGEPLIKNSTVTGFSNVEEKQIELDKVVPFLLEDKLNEVTGNKYVSADQPWGERVVVDKTNQLGGVLITGQNPASATGVGKELLKALGV